MNALSSIDGYHLLTAGIHLVPMLAWAILVRIFWCPKCTARSQGRLLRLFRLLSFILALHYAMNMAIDLIAPRPGQTGSQLWMLGCVLTQVTTIAEMAVLRHLVPLMSLGGTPPSRRWLAVNYGAAITVGALEGLTFKAGHLVHAYLLVMSAAIIWEIFRLTSGRSGPWRPVLMANLSPRAFALFGSVMFLGVVTIVFVEVNNPGRNLPWVIAHSLIGIALAGLLSARILGEVMRRFLVGMVSIVAAAVIYFGTRSAALALQNGELQLLAEVVGVFLLALTLGPGGLLLKEAVDRWVLQQSQRWGQELQEFLKTLQPELGVADCQRRAVQEVAAVLKLRGAGMLCHGAAEIGPESIVAEGKIDLSGLAKVWPCGADDDVLPERAFDLLWVEDLELQKAMHDADITWVVPVTGPRKCWGHLFVSAGPLGIAAGGAKLDTLETFARQLALVLDSADLLDRAVSVERELAQAGKLAAVGEMAARMAHEIRNPVTAARSLAQMLADEPNSPLNAEHAVIITRELDRVEHQVRELLAFARQESYRFEPLCLAGLVASTLDELTPRLVADDDAIHIERQITGRVPVRADGERLRQVLVNLLENAVDALRETSGPRRLTVRVASSETLESALAEEGGTSGGTVAEEGGTAGASSGGATLTTLGAAVLTVSDTGPGIADDMLPRLFEPFVSDKTQGTGLGLAIAQRIVEAHGGKINAEPGASGGTAFHVILPRADDRATDLDALPRAV